MAAYFAVNNTAVFSGPELHHSRGRHPCLISVVATTVATATPATADVASLRDQLGDAPARFDITTVKISNRDDRLVVKARIRDLKAEGTQIYGFTATLDNGSTNYTVTTVRRPSGRTSGELTGYVDGAPQNPSCKVDRTWSPRRNTIEVSIDRSCIAAGRVSINTYIGVGDGSAGDPVDFTEPISVQQG